jgi:hypothetical protein
MSLGRIRIWPTTRGAPRRSAHGGVAPAWWRGTRVWRRSGTLLTAATSPQWRVAGYALGSDGEAATRRLPTASEGVDNEVWTA